MDRSVQIAGKLHDLGFSLIPVRDKKPLIPWREFQERRATKEEVCGWIKKYDCGLGIVCGEISGLLVLDVDHQRPLGQPLPPTWSVKTRRGYHHYFRWKPEYAGGS